MLLQMKYNDSKELRIFCSVVVTKNFIQACLKHFNPLIHESAEKVTFNVTVEM